MVIAIGHQVVVTDIMEKEEAEKAYEEFIKSGNTAAILKQQNLDTNQIHHL